VALGTGAHVRCLGKGRKMRCAPLRCDQTSLPSWRCASKANLLLPMFGDTLASEYVSAVTYSLIETARMNGL